MGNVLTQRSGLVVVFAIAALAGTIGYPGRAQAQTPVCVFVDYVPSGGLSQRPDGPMLDAGVDHDRDRVEAPQSAPPINALPAPPNSQLPVGTHLLPAETGPGARSPEVWQGTPGVGIYHVDNHSYYRCINW
jgi:hypothetical protein